MVDALEIPEYIITANKSVFSGIEALCLTCAHFCTAGDQYELLMKHCHAQSAISEIVNWVATFIDTTWSHLLDFNYTHQPSYKAGAPVLGFIDCTIHHICRPSQWQHQAYSGHKKFHTLKFQAIMLPNGMFGHLFGPHKGCRNDCTLLNHSGILEMCAEHAVCNGTDKDTPDEECYFQLFRDPACGVSAQTQSPFSGLGECMEEEKQWNEMMAQVRIEVELLSYRCASHQWT
jgi:hypothetical protein